MGNADKISVEFQIGLTKDELNDLIEWEYADEDVPPPDAFYKIQKALQEAERKANMEALKRIICEK